MPVSKPLSFAVIIPANKTAPPIISAAGITTAIRPSKSPVVPPTGESCMGVHVLQWHKYVYQRHRPFVMFSLLNERVQHQGRESIDVSLCDYPAILLAIKMMQTIKTIILANNIKAFRTKDLFLFI